jgi:hypothetical protein
MAEQEPELKEYAGGWMTERKGTEVPVFLKYVFPVIAGGAFVYLLYFMNGEVAHPDRGRLVQQFNAATYVSRPFMYAVGAMVLIFLITVVRFAFRKSHED